MAPPEYTPLMRWPALIAVGILSAPLLHAQAEWPKPQWRKVEALSCGTSDRPVSLPVARYEAELVRIPDANTGEFACRGYLVDSARRRTLLLEDREVSIYQGTGADMFGDGNPALILEGFSGGAHCCYTYRIVSLGDSPVILGAIYNEAPFYFFKDPATRQYRIMTGDGAFDYFDGLCHACAPMPRVVLQIDAAGLHDVSSQFTEQYDSEIALARAKIGEGNINKFLISDFQDAKGTVLEIVFSYLYSGREAQAWQALDDMWPAADREHVKQLILKTRANGLLSRIKVRRPVSARRLNKQQLPGFII